MATVYDVAKYIIGKLDAVSAWKLQKLCYYCQAWSIAWTDKPLFAEDFEAWRNGPVCPKLYDMHRGKFMVEPGDITGAPDNLDADQKDTIDTVLAHYGEWEPHQLVEQTHNDDPWKNARAGLSPYESCKTVITKDSMGAFYGSL